MERGGRESRGAGASRGGSVELGEDCDGPGQRGTGEAATCGEEGGHFSLSFLLRVRLSPNSAL